MLTFKVSKLINSLCLSIPLPCSRPIVRQINISCIVKTGKGAFQSNMNFPGEVARGSRPYHAESLSLLYRCLSAANNRQELLKHRGAVSSHRGRCFFFSEVGSDQKVAERVGTELAFMSCQDFK